MTCTFLQHTYIRCTGTHVGNNMDLNLSKEVFVRPLDEYKRQIDPVGHYLEDSVFYISKMTGLEKPTARNIVVKIMKERLVDPKVRYLRRNEYGDRVEMEGTLLEYINETVRNDEAMAATFTCYTSVKVRVSPYSPIIKKNIKRRKVHKGLKFAAEQRGDVAQASIEENNQQNRKTSNNSLSGAQNSSGTGLWNKTAHSTLTSTCRVTAGYGNINNERFICGHRLYRSGNVTLNNLVTVANNFRREATIDAINTYNLTIPTVDDVMEMVTESAKHYWHNHEFMQHIRQFVTTLDPVERAGVLYTGDLASLFKLNSELIGGFIKELATKKHEVPEGMTLKSIESSMPEDFFNLAKLICREETRGLDKLSEIEGTQAYDNVLATAHNVGMTVLKYGKLIRTFFVTDCLPPSVAFVPQMMRHAVVTGDTDSTIFSVENWVEWLTGKVGFDDFSKSISDVMIFLASQTVVDILATMSKNFGAAKEYLFLVTMKNEYKFDVFVPMQMTKHYFAMRSAQEGRVKAKLDMEIKGVHMKSSAAPDNINELAKKMMEDIVMDIHDRQCIDEVAYIKRVVAVERQVMDAIKSGSAEYFKRANIKPPLAYTKGESESPYRFYTLWQEVFAEKYVNSPVPPYDGIGITLVTDRRAVFNEYLNQLPDQALAQRWRDWCARNGKDNMGSIAISGEVINMMGQIPDEILQIIDVRKMVKTICGTFYHLMDSLGITLTERNNGVTLFMDHY